MTTSLAISIPIPLPGKQPLPKAAVASLRLAGYDAGMDVYVCFDVEDLVHPESDDCAMDVARLLSQERVTAHLCVVGEKARLWERRGRRDVIAAVCAHDVGLHTDHHSMHPTVSEYLAEHGWEDGVAEAVLREQPGLHDLRRILGVEPSAWGTSGSSWAPQIPAATARMGIISTLYCHAVSADSTVSWFAGQLGFSRYVSLPGGEDALADATAFAAGLPRVLDAMRSLVHSGAPCVGLFGAHPTRLRHTVFWDVLNFASGRNTPSGQYRSAPRRSDQDYRLALDNLRRMVLSVRDLPGIRIRGVREIAAGLRGLAPAVSPRSLDEIAHQIAQSPDIPPHLCVPGTQALSPAQALYLLARGGEAALVSREVLGPECDPPPTERTTGLSAPEAQALARAVVAHVEMTGRLPVAVPIGGVLAGPGAALRALARARVAGHTELAPGPELPRGAEEQAQAAIDRRLPGWQPHRRDLRLDLLARHTRLQCWSLRPACSTA